MGEICRFELGCLGEEKYQGQKWSRQRGLRREENDDSGLSLRCLKDITELSLMGRTEAAGNN